MDKQVATQSTAPTNLLTFTKDQVELIKSQIAVGATNDELNLFLYQAQRTGLDPLARQIYFVKRQGKMTIQTSIDGFRVIAERSRDYSGQDKPVFEEKSGFKHPISCTVTVYKIDRVGNRVGVGATAYWDEYCPAPPQNFMWNKMPHTMLSKVAEALALRKAFPQDISGIYTDDELDQMKSTTPLPKKAVHYDDDPAWIKDVDKDAPLKASEMREILDVHEAQTEASTDELTTDPTPADPNLASDAQRKMYFALAKEKGYSSEFAKNVVKSRYKLNSFMDVTKEQIHGIIDEMNGAAPEQVATTPPATDVSGESATSQQKMEISRLMHEGKLPKNFSSIFKLSREEADEMIQSVA